jgi:hypothetical protein
LFDTFGLANPHKNVEAIGKGDNHVGSTSKAPPRVTRLRGHVFLKKSANSRDAAGCGVVALGLHPIRPKKFPNRMLRGELMKTMTRRWSVRSGVVVAAAAMLMAVPTVARAQAADPNPGGITFTGGVDVPSVYVFRGILQETDPGFTMWPYGDIGFALMSGDGGVKTVGLNFGVWNSLMTGSSGSDGVSEHLHYEEDFYTTLSLGFSKSVSLGTTYTAYTSPNLMFNTVKELSFKVAQTSRFNPYGILAFELGEHGADGGENKGTYLELGVGPAFPIGTATLSIPVKLGMSLNNYYELNGEDNKFGFFDIGGLITLPLSGINSNFGSWNIHGGVDFLAFGDTTTFFNQDDSSKVVGLIGIGVTY